MLRIAVCDREEARGRALFAAVSRLLGAVGVRCELKLHRDPEKLSRLVAAEPRYLDVCILRVEEFALARWLRERDLRMGLLLTGPADTELKSLLSLRISGFWADGQPVDGADFISCCRQQQGDAYFTVKNREGLLRIPQEQILWMESSQRVVTLHSTDKTVEFYAKLSDAAQQLPGDQFLRCHQSYLVNLRQVTRLDKPNRCFVLRTGQTVEISRANYGQCLQAYAQWVGQTG